LTTLAAVIRERADDVVVLGTGGSSRGAETLVALAEPSRPRLRFIANADPMTWDRTIARLDAARTVFLAVSRSGATPETVAQALLAVAWLGEQIGRAGVADRLVVIAGPGPSPLRALGERHGATVIDHDPELSGRYAVLANVGLLPALIAGIDGAAVRAGARQTLDRALRAPDVRAAAPAVGAALQVGLAREQGVKASVLVAYADALAPFTAWYEQLWAESLGKRGQGTLPVGVLGPAAQHGLLQLLLDGPADKFVTLVVVERAAAGAGAGPRLRPALAGDPALDYLEGRSLGDLMAAAQQATAAALARAGRPVRVLRLAGLDAASLGALLMHMMIETMLAADLLGVDPFDQPAVELGKALARQRLAAG
ncbi:MAG: glucose-6-phosphate isomerase, partial [Alphaproteobacteria bacterium]